ncbi:MAG TPA: hypothetical protein VHN98_07270 [Acidimicrobiales bacterium]|nr:hypothetical protein [Acidimicrobiales bacterium]
MTRVARRARRLIATVTVGLAVAAGATACGHPEQQDVKALRDALARTAEMPRAFAYEETTNDGTKTDVKGVVEDDFRYEAAYAKDGAPVLDEVVYDDELADRFLAPGEIASFLRKKAAPATGARPDGEVTGPDLAAAMRSGKWVVDAAGAPTPLSASAERHPLGEDPVYDARHVFDYVDGVVREMRVHKFNPDSLDYRPNEDPFPKPGRGSKVVRYDVEREPVPRPSDTSTGNQAIPTERSFRKMAIYVKDGVVLQVLEDMDVASRLDDIQRNYDIKLEGSVVQEVDQAVAAINVVRKGQGRLDPIRVRRMSYRLSDVGMTQRVRPPDDGVKANLAVLINRGRVPAAAVTAGSA